MAAPSRLSLLQICSIFCSLFFIIANAFYEQVRSSSYAAASVFGYLYFSIGVIGSVTFLLSVAMLIKQRRLNWAFFLNLLVTAYPLAIVAVFFFTLLSIGPPS